MPKEPQKSLEFFFRLTGSGETWGHTSDYSDVYLPYFAKVAQYTKDGLNCKTVTVSGDVGNEEQGYILGREEVEGLGFFELVSSYPPSQLCEGCKRLHRRRYVLELNNERWPKEVCTTYFCTRGCWQEALIAFNEQDIVWEKTGRVALISARTREVNYVQSKNQSEN